MRTEELVNMRGVKYETKDSRRNVKGGDYKKYNCRRQLGVLYMYICICVIPNPKFIIRIKTTLVASVMSTNRIFGDFQVFYKLHHIFSFFKKFYFFIILFYLIKYKKI